MKPADSIESLQQQIASLTQAQRALLEEWRRTKGVQERAAGAIPRGAERGSAPLSFAQQRLWFLDQLAPGSPAYTMVRGYRVSGDLDHDALRQAVTAVVNRHETLRTTFQVVADQPVQRVEPSQPMDLTLIDLTESTEPERESAAQAFIAAEARRPFELERGPLLRMSLIRMGKRDHILVMAMHHIVSDGWSEGILLRELAAFYEEFSGGRRAQQAELPIQYADFARWQREWLSGEVLEEQLSYWRDQLSGLSVLELPTDRPRPPVQSFRGSRVTVSFSRELTQGLKELSRRESATLYMTLLAGFGALLSRYTGQRDVVVGSPIAGRNRAEIEGLIGFFVNTLVLRTDLSGDPSFRELLGRVREVALEAYAHQDLPFEKLVEELQPARTLGQNPLFQVTLALQNAPATKLALIGASLTPVGVPTLATHADLEVYLTERSDGLECAFVYATDLFDPETVSRMLTHYQRVLEDALANPARRVSDLSMLTQAERSQLLESWNRTEAEYPTGETVSGLFEEQVERTPDADAVAAGDERLTYRQLNERANCLARFLRKRGVGSEVLVGLCVERSLDMIVGLMGILKAGGAYLPLDPTHPPGRLAFMLGDANVRVVLTQADLAGGIPSGSLELVRLDADWPEIARESGENLSAQVRAENLAYVIYTSGSTGVPKGVAIELRSVVNLLRSMQERLRLGPGDVLLAVTTLSFDIAGLEIYLPLITGACVAVAAREVAVDGKALADEWRRRGATVMQATPAGWRLLVDAGWEPEDRPTLLCGGEVLPRDLADRLLEKGSSLWNLYGPTETTIWSTAGRVEADSHPVSIGTPLANTRLYVLDGHGGLVPVGVPGELYIGGSGVARGYLNRPELTDERFLSDPFRPDGARMYRTGDRARFLPGGDIQFLGRLDDQVKIRGHRIEIGEVEAVLARHPDVVACAVAARQEGSGDKRLVGYVVLRDGPSVTDLRDFLMKALPDYMVPSVFVRLTAIPLTPNGKIDRRALPAPDAQAIMRAAESPAPRNPVEERLAGIWCEVLGLQGVGIHDNFFELGGHSLLATLIVARLQAAFAVRLPLRTFFDKPTVAELSSAIEKLRRSDSGPPRSAIVPISRQAISREEASVTRAGENPPKRSRSE
jgi:amino acid adenylation domain-containing protein